MRYRNIVEGCFLVRPNRFIAHVDIGGRREVAHVKNTGRCRELLLPGARVYLEENRSPSRKTAYDLVAVEKGERLINMDSQAPNKVFAEWALAGGFLPGVTSLWPEYSYGDSRLDFAVETPRGLHLVEVKGVTLEAEGAVYFPDAPTERGVKHLRGLMRCVAEGYEAYAVFVIQMRHVRCFSPAWDKHPAFGLALREAAEAGVHILALDCDVTEHSLTIADRVPIDLSSP